MRHNHRFSKLRKSHACFSLWRYKYNKEVYKVNNIPAIAGGTPVRDKKLYYGHQYIDDKDINAVVEVLKSDYLTCGPKIEEVEKKLCKITDAKHACLISNGTAALHVALQAIGVGEGDEIITTPLTFAASTNSCFLSERIPFVPMGYIFTSFFFA